MALSDLPVASNGHLRFVAPRGFAPAHLRFRPTPPLVARRLCALLLCTVAIAPNSAVDTRADGSTWTTVGADTITMASTIYVGVMVCSHNTAQLNTSTFNNVYVGP